jgi:hypothetical protein
MSNMDAQLVLLERIHKLEDEIAELDGQLFPRPTRGIVSRFEYDSQEPQRRSIALRKTAKESQVQELRVLLANHSSAISGGTTALEAGTAREKYPNVEQVTLPDIPGIETLTPMQQEVVSLKSRGLNDSQIATKLRRSRKTISEHFAAATRKLNQYRDNNSKIRQSGSTEEDAMIDHLDRNK